MSRKIPVFANQSTHGTPLDISRARFPNPLVRRSSQPHILHNTSQTSFNRRLFNSPPANITSYNQLPSFKRAINKLFRKAVKKPKVIRISQSMASGSQRAISASGSFTSEVQGDKGSETSEPERYTSIGARRNPLSLGMQIRKKKRPTRIVGDVGSQRVLTGPAPLTSSGIRFNSVRAISTVIPPKRTAKVRDVKQAFEETKCSMIERKVLKHLKRLGLDGKQEIAEIDAAVKKRLQTQDKKEKQQTLEELEQKYKNLRNKVMKKVKVMNNLKVSLES